MAGKKGMKCYPLEFRQMVVDLHLNKGYSKRCLCKEYGISSDTQVEDWCRWYKQYGVPKQITGKVRGRPKISSSLEEDNKRLRMENELLKKFHELLREEHKRK